MLLLVKKQQQKKPKIKSQAQSCAERTPNSLVYFQVVDDFFLQNISLNEIVGILKFKIHLVNFIIFMHYYYFAVSVGGPFLLIIHFYYDTTQVICLGQSHQERHHIHSTNTYCVEPCSMFLDTAVNETEKSLCLHGPYSSSG